MSPDLSLLGLRVISQRRDGAGLSIEIDVSELQASVARVAACVDALAAAVDALPVGVRAAVRERLAEALTRE